MVFYFKQFQLLEDKVIELHNDLSAANLTAENELQERFVSEV